MKQKRRWFRVFKHAALTALVLAAITFLSSLWMTFGFACLGRGAWVAGGGLFVQVTQTSNTHCGHILSPHTFGEFIYSPRFAWRWGWDDGVAHLPLGWLLVFLAALIVVLWRYDRHRLER